MAKRSTSKAGWATRLKSNININVLLSVRLGRAWIQLAMTGSVSGGLQARSEKMSEADCDLDLPPPPPEDVVVSPRIKRRAPPPPAPLIVMDNLEVRDLGDTENYDEPPPSSGGSRSIISQVSVSLPPLPDTPKSKVSSFIEALLFKCQLGTDHTIHKLRDTTLRKFTESPEMIIKSKLTCKLKMIFKIAL